MQAWDYTITVPNEPGILGRIGEEFGRAKINILGLAAFTHKGHEFVHVLVEDRTPAQKVFSTLGYKVEHEQEVWLGEIEDRPGMLGEYGRRLADAGINLTTCYLATNNRVVLGSDDLNALRRAWEGKVTAGSR